MTGAVLVVDGGTAIVDANGAAVSSAGHGLGRGLGSVAAGAEVDNRNYDESHGKPDQGQHCHSDIAAGSAEEHQFIKTIVGPAVRRELGQELHPFRIDKERPPAAPQRGQ